MCALRAQIPTLYWSCWNFIEQSAGAANVSVSAGRNTGMGNDVGAKDASWDSCILVRSTATLVLMERGESRCWCLSLSLCLNNTGKTKSAWCFAAAQFLRLFLNRAVLKWGSTLLRLAEGWAAGGLLEHLYRGTSPIRNRLPLGPYCRHMPRVLPWSQGVGVFL